MTETAPTASPTPKPAEQTVAGGFAAGYAAGANPPAAPAGTAASTGGAIIDKTKAIASDAAKTVEEKSKGVWDSIKGIWDDSTKNGGLGKILGGLLGLVGAWFLGNFFGEGIIGTILTICLAFPLMAIGSDKLGGMFNGWMGNKQPEQQQVARAPEVTRLNTLVARNVEQSQAPRTALTEGDLNAILEDAKHTGVSSDTVRIGTPKDYIRVSVEELRNDLAACRARGDAPVLDLLKQGDGSVTPGCVPSVSGTNSHGRH